VKRTLVDSSMMASVGYDAKHATLEIEFCTGDVYEYFDVPRGVFRALLASSSKGRFFHAEIDGVYRFEKVTPAPRRRR
jgi:KTSC domain-containing protein